MSEGHAGIHWKNVGNYQNGGIKYKLSALLYISIFPNRKKSVNILCQTNMCDYDDMCHYFLFQIRLK